MYILKLYSEEKIKPDRHDIIATLDSSYHWLDAKDIDTASELMDEYGSAIKLIIMVSDKPGDREFDFIKKSSHGSFPVIMISEDQDGKAEIRALKSGASDFIKQPADKEIVRLRAANCIKKGINNNGNDNSGSARIIDELTGLYRREKFSEKTREMLNENTNIRFAFIRMDIDRFQLVNSYFGKETGDCILRYFANILRNYCIDHKLSICGRQEADVFLLCCKYKIRNDLVNIIHDFHKAIKEYPISINLVPTFGIFEIEDTTMPIDRIADRAFLAAKKAKDNYVDSFAFFNGKMESDIENEQAVINEMRPALEAGQFYIVIQPKYSLKTGMPQGGEVLLRWNHPVKGIVKPDSFIPILEKNGFITKVDYYVWEQACMYLKRWVDEGIEPEPISVNVSRVDLYNPEIIEIFSGLVEKYQIPYRLLQLEVTESAYMDNPQIMKQVVANLREQGFTILLDDFGSGYSSLGILKDMDIDMIKIDTKFLTQAESESKGKNIIASIVNMGHEIDIPIIAEGAQKKEQVDFLRETGCEFVQGFYYSKPLSVDDYHDLIKDRK